MSNVFNLVLFDSEHVRSFRKSVLKVLYHAEYDFHRIIDVKSSECCNLDVVHVESFQLSSFPSKRVIYFGKTKHPDYHLVYEHL